jgi:hypothetical protein
VGPISTIEWLADTDAMAGRAGRRCGCAHPGRHRGRPSACRRGASRPRRRDQQARLYPALSPARSCFT